MSEGDRDMETVLKPEQKDMKASLLKAFQAYDINGGQVSRRPRLALLLRNFSLLLKPPPQDGFIDEDEMKAILTRSQASFGKSDLTQGALRETDGRSDTSFSDKQADDRWKSWLSAFDANGDGKLSVEELAEAMSYSGMVYELYQLVYFKKQSLKWSAQLTKLLDELKKQKDDLEANNKWTPRDKFIFGSLKLITTTLGMASPVAWQGAAKAILGSGGELAQLLQGSAELDVTLIMVAKTLQTVGLRYKALYTFKGAITWASGPAGEQAGKALTQTTQQFRGS